MNQSAQPHNSEDVGVGGHAVSDQIVGQKKGEITRQAHAHDGRGRGSGIFRSGKGRGRGGQQKEEAEKHQGPVDHQSIVGREPGEGDRSRELLAVPLPELKLGRVSRRLGPDVVMNRRSVAHWNSVNRGHLGLRTGEAERGVGLRRGQDPRADVAGSKNGNPGPGLTDLCAEGPYSDR